MFEITFKILIFSGLNASNEDLNLKAQNIWAFTTNESGDTFDKYLDMDVEEAMDAKVPLMFISFPRYCQHMYQGRRKVLQSGRA